MSELNGSTAPPRRHPLPADLLHDLRTPLNQIIGYSELMAEQAEGEDAARLLLPHLRKVAAAARQMATLITENLEVGPPRVEATCESASRIEQSPAPLPEAACTETWTGTGTGTSAAEAAAAVMGSVLIVDDDDATRETLVSQVKQAGCSVVSGVARDQALSVLRAGSFDVVFLDLVMTQPDGFEVLRRIRADDQLKHLPIIVTSSLAEVEAVACGIDLGADDYLIGPFHPALLHARIRTSLERKRANEGAREVHGQLQGGPRDPNALQASRHDSSTGPLDMSGRP